MATSSPASASTRIRSAITTPPETPDAASSTGTRRSITGRSWRRSPAPATRATWDRSSSPPAIRSRGSGRRWSSATHESRGVAENHTLMAPKTPAFNRALLFLTLALITIGGALWLGGLPLFAGRVWAGATLCALIPLAVSVLKSLFQREVGVDVIALLAMAGALALGEYLTGSVIALM